VRSPTLSKTQPHLTEAMQEIVQREESALYDLAPCGYHSLDARGMFIAINQTELAMLGYKHSELVNTKKLFDILTPESQALFELHFPALIQKGWIKNLEVEMIRKNGSLLPIRVSSQAVYDDKGHFVMCHSVLVDISDHKDLDSAKEKYETETKIARDHAESTLEKMSDGFTALDRNWRYTYVNHAGRKIIQQLTGRAVENVMGHTFWEVFPMAVGRESESKYRNAMTAGIPAHYETWVEWTNTWFEMHIYPSATGIGVYFREITAKKLIESQLIRAQRLDSLGLLAGGIAHDLNNVLTPIVGISQLLPLRLSHLDESSKRLLKILAESSQRGVELVKQILSFSQGTETQKTNLKIFRVMAEIEKIVRQTFPREINFVLKNPQNVGTVFGDATMIHQVILNLCVNARDAMPEGGVLDVEVANVFVDTLSANKNIDARVGEYVCVKVSDTGTGISPEIMDRIFDPFFTTKDVGKGTGLGLSTVLGHIKLHKGFLNIHSELGQGTQFLAHFPVSENAEVLEPEAEKFQVGQDQVVLVVDDEAYVREVTQITLESNGYKTLSAKDGVEAISIFATQKDTIDFVLLDRCMPQLDLSSVVMILKGINPQVNIVVMSGLETPEILKVLKSHDCQFLPKPFKAEDLLMVLAQYNRL
jgi:two-component system, cell cycle sensor histidine kinase and response regulator CckA